ncbi:right-handed parallel beta-helix repeat-containing protein [Mucilaginibacter calamicampi]|uniref:Right-handed parallel beta-helix repeat-containing protein n=1 Tax=Mucilaginibacter calamicampi TaxID=1302352 RepID=A0ABW2YYF7_9SPHI
MISKVSMLCFIIKTVIMLMHLHPWTQNKQNYYVDSNAGDDNNAGTVEHPWKTLLAVNGYKFKPGDKIFFKRGQVFYGPLFIKSSGTKANNITFGAYGRGSLPKIQALTTITKWQYSGGGIWETACERSVEKLNLLLIDKKPMPVGRFPNYNSKNGGYITYRTTGKKNTIALQPNVQFSNWLGAELVVRRTWWSLEKGVITESLPRSITYNGNSPWEAMDKFGFFIQRGVNTLDTFGEWYYDPLKERIQIYFGLRKPHNHSIMVSTIDDLVTVSDARFIRVTDLAIEGANSSAIKIIRSSNINISDNIIYLSGGKGIEATLDIDSLTLRNNYIDHCNDIAIKSYRSTNATITNNTISNTGLFPGMGVVYSALDVNGDNMLLYGNNIRNCGYNGIRVGGNKCIIRHNLINNFNLILQDGAGIYLDGAQYKKRSVIENFISNGIGNSKGTAFPHFEMTVGIYADDGTSEIEIISNTVSTIRGHGIKVHNASDIKINRNILYDSSVQIILDDDGALMGTRIRNMIVTNNICISKKGQSSLALTNARSTIGTYGIIDSNYYIRQMSQNDSTFSLKLSGLKKSYNFSDWKKNALLDVNSFTITINSSDKDLILSRKPSGSLVLLTNPTKAVEIYNLYNSIYYDLHHNKYSKKIKVPAYSAKVLLKN